MKNTDNAILNKSFEFACEILDLYTELTNRRQFVVANQVCKSGTSIGANVREAQRAVSKADFINKLGIALKEADETAYWFELIDEKIIKLKPEIKNELDELIRLLVSIINASKKPKPNNSAFKNA